MPPWKQPDESEPTNDVDNWEVHAIAIATRLDSAADELRKLVDQIRVTRRERGERD